MVKIATLVGCAIGDALGNPFEMKLANYEPLMQWDGQFKEGGTFWWGQPGQYTDDTLMSIALSLSLIENQGFNQEDIASKYLAWMESGNTRGIGGTTAASLTRLKHGASVAEAGLTHNEGKPVAGNGTAMRASPIGLVYQSDLIKLIEVAIKDAVITHNGIEPKVGSAAVALGTALLASRASTPQTVTHDILDVLADSIVKSKLEETKQWLEQGTPLDTIAAEALASIGTKGYVPETVAAAFFCVGATDNYKDAVVMAVKGGGDTDTTAAIAGALAGSYYGLEGIPDEYKNGVENFQLLQSLTDELLKIKISHESLPAND
jgi:ADP-ribosyl-[dinitrogen reductase] hydrolase